MRRSFFASSLIMVLLLPMLAGWVEAQLPPGLEKASNVIIGLAPDNEGTNRALEAIGGVGGMITARLWIINAVAVTLPERAIPKLKADPNIRYIESDAEVQAIQDTVPWGLTKIRAQEAWETSTGTNIRIGILDTGIDKDHKDLLYPGKVAGGVNFYGTTKDWATDPKVWDDKNGHGTHVAGTAAAAENGAGVVGVAKGAKLYAIKVLSDSGTGYLSDVIQGIQWCAGYNKNGTWGTKRVEIANMSLGTTTDSTSLRNACDVAYSKGILLVASAGNNGDGNPDNVDPYTYPAAYDSVVAVGATDQNNNVASFSTSAPYLELAAPGVEILSDWPNNKLAILSGTSMSAPHVSGTAALVWISLGSNVAVRDRLINTAVDLGIIGRDNGSGYGRVDAKNAVLGYRSAPRLYAVPPINKLPVTWGKIKGE